MDVYTILIKEDDYETSQYYVGTYLDLNDVLEVVKNNFEYDHDSIQDEDRVLLKHIDDKLRYRIHSSMLYDCELSNRFGNHGGYKYYINIYVDTINKPLPLW